MCQDYYAMFYSCHSLESIKFPTLSNTSQGIYDASGSLNSFVSYPINMSQTFQGCWKLKSVDLSSFEGKSVNKVNSMFDSAKVITEIDISPLVVSSDILSLAMFFFRCYKLEKIKGLKYISTKNVTHMGHAFSSCKVITDLSDINGWNTENTDTMYSFLEETNALTDINLNNWCVKNITEKPSKFVLNSNIETTISKHPRWGVCPPTNLDNTPTVLINRLPPTPTPSVSASHSHSTSPSESIN
jgi:surface protein